MPRDTLDKLMFPLGEMRKSTDVRRIASENDLITKNKRDSFGVCFIGERKFSGITLLKIDFLQLYIPSKKGIITDLADRVIGEHNGIFSFTIGQSIKVGGLETKYFVCRKDINENKLIACNSTTHPSLFSNYCIVYTFILFRLIDLIIYMTVQKYSNVNTKLGIK